MLWNPIKSDHTADYMHVAIYTPYVYPIQGHNKIAIYLAS